FRLAPKWTFCFALGNVSLRSKRRRAPAIPLMHFPDSGLLVIFPVSGDAFSCIRDALQPKPRTESKSCRSLNSLARRRTPLTCKRLPLAAPRLHTEESCQKH